MSPWRPENFCRGGPEVVPGPALPGSGHPGLLQEAGVVDHGHVVGVAGEADQFPRPGAALQHGRVHVRPLAGPVLLRLELGVHVHQHPGGEHVRGVVVGGVGDVRRGAPGGEGLVLVQGGGAPPLLHVDRDLLLVGLVELVQEIEPGGPLGVRLGQVGHVGHGHRALRGPGGRRTGALGATPGGEGGAPGRQGATGERAAASHAVQGHSCSFLMPQRGASPRTSITEVPRGASTPNTERSLAGTSLARSRWPKRGDC